MGKKIIVAGGGHGGIAAGMLLAKKGFDVTVYEKNKRKNMGYDWTDIFDRKGFFAVGLPMPPEDKYGLKDNMTFIPPSGRVKPEQDTPEDQLEIQMERTDIYDMLISGAEEAGVKFEYGVEVLSPIMTGSRIVGVKTDGGEKYADLVIDAAGIDSPLRTQLPDYLGIQQKPAKGEQIYIYRAFYNKTARIDENKFRVFLLFRGKTQVCWVAAEPEYTDVLIGRFEPFGDGEVQETLDELRKECPDLGGKVERGGQFVKIPVRQPLGVMVADGYAAIGDSAFMTMPLIGSGIANSLKAARMLADTVAEDEDGLYSAQTLWKYQRRFYSKLGNGLAPIAHIRMLATCVTADDLDYMFENEMLSANDLTMGADTTSLIYFLKRARPDEFKPKLGAAAGNLGLTKKIVMAGAKISAVTAALAAMPPKYDRSLVVKWVKAYNACFKS